MKSYDILDYRGHWLLLDYMKTDRPASKPLSKELAQLKARLGAKVAILQIVLPPDNTATVAKYVADTKTTAPHPVRLRPIRHVVFQSHSRTSAIRFAPLVCHQPARHAGPRLESAGY